MLCSLTIALFVIRRSASLMPRSGMGATLLTPIVLVGGLNAMSNLERGPDTNDKIVVIREIKLTITFVGPEVLIDLNTDYNTKVDDWIKENVLTPFNGKYGCSDIPPLMAYIKAEDVTS